jgi:hypothetical protein
MANANIDSQIRRVWPNEEGAQTMVASNNRNWNKIGNY